MGLNLVLLECLCPTAAAAACRYHCGLADTKALNQTVSLQLVCHTLCHIAPAAAHSGTGYPWAAAFVNTVGATRAVTLITIAVSCNFCLGSYAIVSHVGLPVAVSNAMR